MSTHHQKRHHALHASANATFIAQAKAPAQLSEVQTGVPASVTIAQAILESAWGKHHIGAANNYFGVKAQTKKDGSISVGKIASGYVSKDTREYIKKTNEDITITASFRSYNTMADSFVDHGLFLRGNPRYRSNLDEYSKNGDADAFARGLQKAGYATDPHYADLLIQIMRHHDLYQYNSKKPAIVKTGNLP